jgi:hypothetical protein
MCHHLEGLPQALSFQINTQMLLSFTDPKGMRAHPLISESNINKTKTLPCINFSLRSLLKSA